MGETYDKLISLGEEQILCTRKKAWSNQMYKISRNSIKQLFKLPDSDNTRIALDKNCIYFY